MKKLFLSTIIASFALILGSCSNDDDANNDNTSTSSEPTTIVDFVSNNSEDYSDLGAALEAAGLVDVLNGTTEYTVFAPNNDSFKTFLSDNGFSTLEDVPVDLLRQVLLNHVVTGSVLSTDLSTGYVNTNATFGDTENNLSMYINTSNGVLINGTTSVAVADIAVDNGVIHAVDAVIDLPTVVTFATADSTFEKLVSALTREESFNFVETLGTLNGTTPAPFTVFAPTNGAFTTLLDDLELSELGDIPTATLEATLNTHVVTEANVRAGDLALGDNPISSIGANFTINVGDAGVVFKDLNNRSGNIIKTDVQAANGVIHVVDTVILPAL